MGSFFAGVKAGTLAGILYVGGIAVFNVSLLYGLKPDVLASIAQRFPTACPMVTVNGTSAQDCFASVVAVDVPYMAFVAFFVTLLYSGLFGTYHDHLERIGTIPKGMAVAALVGATLILFGFSGYVFDSQSAVATDVFMAAWTVLFGYFLGRLYKRYTRVVGFESEDRSLLKVVVDGRTVTGKSRTFAVTSSHRVRAEVGNGASFREWESSGGVTLEDPRSFETLAEVNDDGVLRGRVTAKY